MQKILSIILVGVLIIPVLGASSISLSIPHLHQTIKVEKKWEFITTFNDNSSRVLIYLDINGISYGHELLWKANTTGTNYEESAVVYFNGVAYISSCSTHGNGHDKLFAVDTTNGDILWNTHIGPGYVGPVIDNDRIYIGTSSHGYDPTNEYIYCINRTDGAVIWWRNIYGGIPESIQYDEDKIYFTSNIIYALDKENGAIIWTYQMDAFSVTKPLLKDNAFFTATSGGTMYKVNITDGSRMWEVSLSDFSWDNSITADGKGHIFLALYGDRTINAYNEETGVLLWSYQLHGRSLSFNAYHDNVLFISDTSGYVYALNSSNGILLWEKKIGEVIDISSPSISGGLLVIGTRDFKEGAFFALNETSGNVLWKYTVGASVTAPPSIANGMVLCGTDDWNMYAFDFGIGSGDWLLHRYDSSNTAYSPNGLTTWQYVSASCTTLNNMTICTVTNTYDHDVSNVKLELSDGIGASWYDPYGNLLKLESDYYMIDNISSLASLTYIITKDEIHPPFRPTITGPPSGKIDIEYEYSFVSTDVDGDEISYYIDWGDGTYTGWTRTLPSGEPFNVSHIWEKRDTFIISAKAKDKNVAESDWATLEIRIPKNKAINPFIPFLERLMEWFPILEQILKPIYDKLTGFY